MTEEKKIDIFGPMFYDFPEDFQFLEGEVASIEAALEVCAEIITTDRIPYLSVATAAVFKQTKSSTKSKGIDENFARVVEQYISEMQYKAAINNPNTIVGSKFERDTVDSTVRYTHWANNLTPEQLNVQVLTSHGPTVIMPTWFCSRETFDKVGGFDESGKGDPEDLIFFYRHLDLEGKVHRVDEVLLIYRYHPLQVTFSIDENVILKLRLERLQRLFLEKWDSFTIWNAGKQGRRLYRSLTEQYRKRVASFCDVDVKKIQQGQYIYEDSKDRPKPRVPIVHFQNATPPFVICVKLDLTKGEFESNLKSLNLRENIDYVMFS